MNQHVVVDECPTDNSVQEYIYKKSQCLKEVYKTRKHTWVLNVFFEKKNLNNGYFQH